MDIFTSAPQRVWNVCCGGCRQAVWAGVSDTEIKIGQTSAYNGPASPYGTISKTEAAYLRMINERGGFHGRKITLISLRLQPAEDGRAGPQAR
jgi:branched-chain amino acid transport system substrate-binding protein